MALKIVFLSGLKPLAKIPGVKIFFKPFISKLLLTSKPPELIFPPFFLKY